MRLFKRIALVLLVLLIFYVGYILNSSGFFRVVEPLFDGTILHRIPIKGAEDIMVSREDSFALISATERLIYPPDTEEKGGLYLIDLTKNDFTPIPLTDSFEQPFAPHGISFIKKDSTYLVMAINHTLAGHSIEVFELYDQRLTHIETRKHPSMIQPNDLVLIDENRFYFTNDHGYTEGLGKLAEEYLGLALSNVVYFDGQDYREVDNGIAYANGINVDPARNLLYVASPRHFLVKVYTRNTDGSLSFIENIPCATGVDNIDLDEAGHLWIGAHPNLLRFAAYAKGRKATTPSEVIKIDYRGRGDYSIEQIYVEKGDEMSGSTVAVAFGNLVFVGNVMDEAFLVLALQ
ncbi:MAG: SMP-30/gluconolactonase/LRE family protein [Bacteroidota bacterium]